MRKLLAATSLTPFVLLAAANPANAERVISTAITTPLATATENDDIRISSTGSVRPTGGVAVTINSNHDVRNEGTIGISGANNSTGILANPNLTSNITNTGTITIDENFTPSDSDNDGDADGTFAQGTNRFGIHVLSGGTHTGTVVNSGTITIEGNNSAGIAVDSALTGTLRSNGTITVTGNNSYGIRAGDVGGNFTLSGGTISAQGGGSVGVSVGDVGGALTIQNTVRTTGYRNTTAPADVSKLDADDLLQGGSAVVIAGNVAGGILFDARPADNSTTDTDEDDDGVADANEPTAEITTYGAAPAVLVGSTSEDIAIGAVASSTAGHGMVVKGSVTGAGVYEGIAGNGIVVGGTGHAVTVAGGMTVAGTVTALANKGNATGIRIGSGASVPVINVTGKIQAEGGGSTTTSGRGIVIDSGANVSTIRNSGEILVGARSATGTATAILDNAGTVGLVENRGSIRVVGADDLEDDAIAIDLRANGAGATVRQLAVTSGTAPSIIGDLRFGAGGDTLDVADGTIVGSAYFGAGGNRLALSGDAVMTGNASFGAGADAVDLSGTSAFNGNMDFGGGADAMGLAGTSTFNGKLSGGSGLAVNVGSGSTLNLTNIGAVELGSLAVANGGAFGVTVGSTGATLYDVSGTASFGTDSTVNVNFLNVGDVEGSYQIVEAGSLVGADNLTASLGDIPFLFDGEIVTDTPGEVSLDVRVKSADELGLNESEGSILDAVLGAADSDAPIAQLLLNAEDSEALQATIQQMLPEHAGGAFETVTKPSRLTSAILLDPGSPIVVRGSWGMWLQQVAWGTSKSIGSTSSYDITGWGASGGLERRLGDAGGVGLSLSFSSGKDGARDNELIGTNYEAGIYWRGAFGPFHAFARGSAGHVNFDGTRRFTGEADGQPVIREAESDWSGNLFSASAGVAYDGQAGRFIFRPYATIEHYKLNEKSYEETGGGTAFDLSVDKRDSDETAVNAMLALGYSLMGGSEPEDAWMRVELEGGRRQILSGSLGKTTARFDGGDPFTLTPEERSSGFRAALRLIGGGPNVSLIGEVNAEEVQDDPSIGGRIGVQFTM